MVAKGDGLGALQMRIARHDGRFVFRRAIYKRLDQRFHLPGNGVALLAQIHPQVERNLIVPAARGVQLFAHVTEPFGQNLLDEHVDVLACGIELQLAGAEIVQNGLQPVDQGIGVRLWQNTGRAEHGGVRHAAGDVLPVHPAVKADGRVEIVRQTVGLPVRAPGPHLRHARSLPFLGNL